MAACTICAPGYFGASIINSGTTSASGCTPCPTGLSTGNVAGSTTIAACSSCAAGYVGSASGGCTICSAGSWGESGMTSCKLCSPGTYSSAGASACTPCPAGTYGSAAGLATSACSGTCSPASACPLGTAFPPPVSSLSCTAGGSARAAPPSLSLLLWPAAHPQNAARVDVVVAPLEKCQQLTSAAACSSAASIAGADGVVRYVIGTAAALHLEAAEQLACSPQ